MNFFIFTVNMTMLSGIKWYIMSVEGCPYVTVRIFGNFTSYLTLTSTDSTSFVMLFLQDVYPSLKCWSGEEKDHQRRAKEGVLPNATNRLYFHQSLESYFGHSFELKTISCSCDNTLNLTFVIRMLIQAFESWNLAIWNATIRLQSSSFHIDFDIISYLIFITFYKFWEIN